MRQIIPSVLALVSVFLCSFLPAQDKQKPIKLSKKNHQSLQQYYLPGIAHKNLASIVHGANQIIRRNDSEGFQKVESYLKSKRIPTISTALPEARIRLASMNVKDGLPHPGIRELEIVVPKLLKQIQNVQQTVEQFSLAQERIKPAENWRAYERQFWTSHVLKNRIQNSQTALKWIRQSIEQLKADKKAIKKLNDKQSALVNANYKTKLNEIKQIETRLAEGDIELRIYRMEDAVRTLADAKSSALKKLDAAFAIEQDAVVLNDAIRKHKGNNTWFRRPNLRDQSVAATVNELIIAGRKHGGNWQEKAALLKVAIHWWQRGRYGFGPEKNGLLKSKTALMNQREMFRLIMPLKMPNRQDVQSQKVAFYPLRHLHNWAIEYSKPLPKGGDSYTRVEGRVSLFNGFV